MGCTLQGWLRQASQSLAEAQLETPRREAELLLCHLLQKNTAYLFTWPEQLLEPQQQQQLQIWLNQRLEGQPLAWILGEWEFWGLPLKVSPATLIPRADTESLVEAALNTCKQKQARILDLGTGTGAIALALKHERPAWQVEAVDINPAAVQLARDNARQLQLDVRIWQSDWWQGIPQGEYDLILSNPPYIRPEDPHLTQGDLRYEPASALVGGDDGLQAYRQLLAGMPRHLKPGGWLLVEQGYDQEAALQILFQEAGLVEVATLRDYAGQPRVTLGCWKKHNFNVGM